MAEAVYILCGLTSLTCLFLLWRAYRQTRSPLLLWSSFCFAALAANNILLGVDLLILPDAVDLLNIRTGTMLVGLVLMLYGLVWEKV